MTSAPEDMHFYVCLLRAEGISYVETSPTRKVFYRINKNCFSPGLAGVQNFSAESKKVQQTLSPALFGGQMTEKVGYTAGRGVGGENKFSNVESK